MRPLRGLARVVADALGRDSRVVRTFRPAYESLLDLVSLGRGIEQTLNGRERFRIAPRYRHFFPDVYDPAVMAYLRQRVRPGATCLNVGAHVGIYTLCLAEWAGPHGRVVAFEPNAATRAVLERHVALNAFQNRVLVESFAVSDTTGSATFIAAGREGTSRLERPGPATGHARPVPVPVTTVDDYCAARHLAPDWLTIDTEGWEFAALEGARRTIEARRERLGMVVELHPNAWADTGWDAARARAFLEELRLVAVPLTGQRDALDEYGIAALEPAGPASAA